MSNRSVSGRIDTRDLLVEWAEAPWDTAVMGAPVLQIANIEVRGANATTDLGPFVDMCDAIGCTLVSCRLPHERLRESMFLEEAGFRFIEMVYQPEITDLSGIDTGGCKGLSASLAENADLNAVLEIAGKAFGNERFHVDPRIPSHVGDVRYQNWVRQTLQHPRQRLYVLRDNGTVVAFFVVEHHDDGTCYWHLNAVAPQAQGKGYGKRAWLTMLARARQEGASRVRTSIVARNVRVLNLYARLGFRFSEPSMTFHWIRSS